jgi:ferric-dicitrate binding protein FerR (iron transport regulator)
MFLIFKSEKMKIGYWNIITKHLFNEALNKEEETFISLANDDNEMIDIINEAKKTTGTIEQYFKLGSYDKKEAWKKVNKQISNTKTFSLGKQITRFAAAFLIMLATSVAVWQYSGTFSNERVFATGNYDISRPIIELPDGTLVTLNHGSELVYPKKFTGNQRNVSLKGEAFFEVEPNPQQPFIIETDEAFIQVIGTSFNVNAYQQQINIEVAVETGRVEFQNKKEKKILVMAGEKGIINRKTGTITKVNSIKPNTLSWKTRQIEFNSTSLGEALSLIENVYGINTNVDNNVNLQNNITATFNQHEKDYILQVLALTLDLEISPIDENNYFITTKK